MNYSSFADQNHYYKTSDFSNALVINARSNTTRNPQTQNHDIVGSHESREFYINQQYIYFHGLIIDTTTRQIVLNVPNIVLDQLSDSQIRQITRKSRLLKTNRYLYFKHPRLKEFVNVETFYLKFFQDKLSIRRKEEIPQWEILKGKKVLGSGVVNKKLNTVVYIHEDTEEPIPQESVRYWSSERILEDCYLSIQFSQSYSDSIKRSLNTGCKNEGIFLYQKITHDKQNKQKLNSTIKSCLTSIDYGLINSMREMSMFYFDCFSLFYQILVCVDIDHIIGDTKKNIEILKTSETELDIKEQALKELFVDFMTKNIILFVQILVPYLVNLDDSRFLDCFDCLKRLDVLHSFAISCMLLEFDEDKFVSVVSPSNSSLNEEYEGWRILRMIYDEKKKEIIKHVLDNGNSKHLELPDYSSELNPHQDISVGPSTNHRKKRSLSISENEEQDVPDSMNQDPLAFESAEQYCTGPDSRDVYTCTYGDCDFQSYRKSEILFHVKRHIGAQFRCMQCSKYFNREKDLESHVETHSNLLERVLPPHPLDQYCQGPDSRCMYTCTYENCGVQLTFKKNMHIHIRTHIEEANLPIACPHCPRKFKALPPLSNHLKSHSDIMDSFSHIRFEKYWEEVKHGTYKCTFNNCGESFKSKFILRNHIVSHLNSA